MKSALLCVSFGTSVDTARESITAVENVMQQAAPGLVFMRAFTSPTIRRILRDRGEVVFSVEQALAQLCQWGFQQVIVQPTHVLYGYEYEKLRQEAEPWGRLIRDLRLGHPLLGTTQDIQALAAVMSQACPRKKGRAIVLFGHGTDHYANAAYPALQLALQLIGRRDMLVGTVEGWPSYEDVSTQLKALGFSSVELVPLMLVAGDHALKDMSGSEDSWKARLEAEGYSVSCSLRGMGLIPGVQELYRRHLEAIL